MKAFVAVVMGLLLIFVNVAMIVGRVTIVVAVVVMLIGLSQPWQTLLTLSVVVAVVRALLRYRAQRTRRATS